MPPTINGLPIAAITATKRGVTIPDIDKKMSQQLSQFVSTSSQLSTAIKRIEQLESTHNQLLQTNTAMVQLFADLVQKLITTGTLTLASGIPPATVSSSPPPTPSWEDCTISDCGTEPFSPVVIRTLPVDPVHPVLPSATQVVATIPDLKARGRRTRQRRDIARLSAIVDCTATHYNQGKSHLLQGDTDIIPADFSWSWHTCCEEVEEEHTRPLPPSLPPPVVPYPTVEWTKVRPSPRSLPQPELFPISGCPEDPEFYPAYDKRKIQLAATPGFQSATPPSPF